MRCAAGHPVGDGERFCPQCGLVVRCPNLHPVALAALFCPECGAQVKPSPATGPITAPEPVVVEDAHPASRPVRSATRKRSRARIALIGLGAVLAFGLVLGTVGAIVNRDKDDPAASGDDTDDVYVPTEYDLCVDEMITVTTYMLENRYSDAALNEVAYEYGTQSPEFQAVLDWGSELNGVQVQYGSDAADERMWELVADYCDSAT